MKTYDTVLRKRKENESNEESGRQIKNTKTYTEKRERHIQRQKHISIKTRINICRHKFVFNTIRQSTIT